MNKYTQKLFSILLPFIPLWTWLCFTILKKPFFNFILSIVLLPIASYFVVYINKKLPKYLLCFIIFTIYHVGSIYVNNTFPPGAGKIYYLLSDYNVLACLLLIVVEYTVFDDKFIARMNKNILIIVIISLVVSLIQIKDTAFFFYAYGDEDALYSGGNRNFSIYSWSDLNSLGITFPILIGILVSFYDKKKSILPLVIFCDIVVSFLTRTRYIMISGIIVLLPLILNKKRSLTKRVSFVVLLLVGVVVIGLTAKQFGFDIDEVIKSRIMEADSDMASARARVRSYEVFLIVFPDNPWFGVGPETRADVLELLGGGIPGIHIGYLCYLYFYGIVGSSFIFLSLFFLLRMAWTVGKRDNFWGAFYGVLALCIANITFIYYNYSEMGIILSAIYLKYFNDKASAPVDEFEFSRNRKNLITSKRYLLNK